ncbi:GTP cyclohydrolase II RibA [Tersicoccus sp. MR15.9]|uniref:GTP cyclohydrolase II RibA n=1 Tax=Tersicoccus mangrovi TaxID=3121635 RepID=UPI002FE6AA63
MTAHSSVVTRVATTSLPCRHGVFDMLGFVDDAGIEHVVLSQGDLSSDVAGPPMVRVHSECLTGDGFGSWRCDCGDQLDAALATIAAVGRGAVVYLRGHEGRGIGLAEKLRAYELQDTGMDTVDANLALGHEEDARTYHAAAAILASLGATRISLLSGNPAKQLALEALGIEVVGRHNLAVPARAENERYLATKRARMRHDPAADTDPELIGRYGDITGPERVVIAQMGQSADGFIAARGGDGAELTSVEDREHLHRLRALVDAVVVGAGTVVADDPQLTVRSVPGINPVRVVVDPSARISPAARVLTDGAAPTLWLVGGDAVTPEVAPHVTVTRLPSAQDGILCTAILDMLADRGLGRVLIEGGGRTVSRFLAAGAIDHLFLTIAPVLIGDGVPGVRFPGAERLDGALRPPSRSFPLGPDTCLHFDLRSDRRPAAEESTA